MHNFLKAHDANGNEVDFSEVEYYINKFSMKMQGSTIETARGWVECAGLSAEETELVWDAVKKLYYSNL